MDDIFQKAIEGNSASIKQLYTSSVGSAYRSISAVCTDDGEAVQLVKEIYLWAFNSAKSYDEFFSLLNQRAAKSVKVLIDKNAALEPITASESVFADLEKMDIPDELKSYPEALCPVVIKNALQREEKATKKPLESLRKKKKEKPGTELEEFEELVKKREFSAVTSSYTPPEPEEVKKPKSISEKLQNDEVIFSDEEKIKQKIEMRKSRKASIIAFIFAAVILAGAVATYFVTYINKEFKAAPQNKKTTFVNSTENTSPYKEGEQLKAFEDYYEGVILKSSHPVAPERTVAYDETKDIGLDRLNGIVSTMFIDVDGDSVEEFAVIRAEVSPWNNVYRYSFVLDLYRFNNLVVETVCSGYNLIDYSVYNNGIDYDFGNFSIDIKLSEKNPARIVACAVNNSYKVYAFHYFENGKIYQAERFVYLKTNENATLILQASADGTYTPIYLKIYSASQKDVSSLDSESQTSVKDYGFDYSTTAVKYSKLKSAIDYINSLSVKYGCKFNNAMKLKLLIKDTHLICSMTAQNEQGDMLSRREVVQIKGKTGIKVVKEEKTESQKTTSKQKTSEKNSTTKKP